MNDRVVYTAVVGNLDSLRQPEVVGPGYDYVCFVRKGTEVQTAGGVWQIREIPVDIQDDRLLARYTKTHPEELLEGYSWCVWMDGNISVRSASFYLLTDAIIGSGALMAISRHPRRDCAYDEALAVLSAGKARLPEMLRAVNFLASEAFPRHAGLFETNVMLRSLRSGRVRELDALWWKCIESVSRRDQISLVYCARKAGVDIVPLFPEGTDVRSCEWVTYAYHDKAPQRGWWSRKWNGLRQLVSKWLLRRRIARI